ncbi:MAG: adenosine deaminase family protein [Myxococcota bacterium]|nr:adenosine deaminase family protein [Myxococcota bacterium]
MTISDVLIQALPKTDLHLHLDGSLRLQTLIDLAQRHKVSLPSYTPEGLKELVFKESYSDLGEYLAGFAYTCAVLQTPAALEQVAYELAWDNIEEGVRYIEVRFAPQLHTHANLSLDDVFLAVDRGISKAQREFEASDAVQKRGEPPFRYGIIACALRMFQRDTLGWYGSFYQNFYRAEERTIFSQASLELVRNTVRCRDRYGIPIVGFDLAGQEDGYPPSHHKSAYQYAHLHFLNRTVHAGEAYGPKSIMDAITVLHADRIGHGYHLFSPELCDQSIQDKDAYTRRLIDYIANRRITVEVCISSNMQTNPKIKRVRDHHFGLMLKERLSATICTDNRLISNTSVSKELRIAVDAFQMSKEQLKDTLIYGFKRSFYHGPYIEKRAYVRKIIDYAEQVLESDC